MPLGALKNPLHDCRARNIRAIRDLAQTVAGCNAGVNEGSPDIGELPDLWGYHQKIALARRGM